MARDIKKLLEERLKENTATHKALHVGTEVDMGSEHRRLLVGAIEQCRLQPRRAFDKEALQALADSIEANGLIEPIVVRPHPSGDQNRYELIAGERRWRAHQLLKMVSIEAIVVHRTDAQVAQMVLVENLQREDLTDYEVGASLAMNMGLFDSKLDMAKSLGMGRGDLYRYLAFAELPAFIREDLDANPALLGRAAAEEVKGLLAKLTPPEELLRDVWTMVKEGRLAQKEFAAAIARGMEGGVWTEPEEGGAPAAGEGEAPVQQPAPSRVADELRARRLEALQATKKVVKMSFGGKTIGTYAKDNRNLVIRFKAALLPLEKEAELQRFIERLLSDEAAE